MNACIESHESLSNNFYKIKALDDLLVKTGQTCQIQPLIADTKRNAINSVSCGFEDSFCQWVTERRYGTSSSCEWTLYTKYTDDQLAFTTVPKTGASSSKNFAMIETSEHDAGNWLLYLQSSYRQK